MRQTLLFLGVFIVLAGIVYFNWQGSQKSQISSIGADRLFAVEEIDQVERVFLADRMGNNTDLKWNGSFWVYNGKYKANQNAVNNLLDAIKRVQMKYKPADAAVEGMVNSLATNGIKVEIYDGQDRLLKSYYVGGATIDERGTYMIMEGANQPYVCSIPAWEGNIRFRYNLIGLEWRDKTVIGAKLEEIETISVNYPKQKNRSFKLVKAGNKYEVFPYYDITPTFKEPILPGAIEQYLTGFQGLVAEAFENNHPHRDSISEQVPFCIVTLQKKGQTQIDTVQFHPIFSPHYYAADNPQSLVATNVERFFATCSSGDFMLVQNRLFKKIFWGYDFFFKE